jgi:hypothetical protein
MFQVVLHLVQLVKLIQMRNLLIIFLFSFLSCGNPNNINFNNTSENYSREEEINNSISSNSVQSPLEIDSVLNYVYENDTLIQKIEIQYLSKEKISFLLTSENKQNKKIFKIQGTALSIADSDPEIDEDEEGSAYPAQQYIYENECWLSIRIDLEEFNRIRIIEGNCEKLHHKSCPFESVGILRK